MSKQSYEDIIYGSILIGSFALAAVAPIYSAIFIAALVGRLFHTWKLQKVTEDEFIVRIAAAEKIFEDKIKELELSNKEMRSKLDNMHQSIAFMKSGAKK